MKVLVIEDEPLVAKSLELSLREEKHIIDCTGSGEDGLQIAKLYSYDAIIIDLGLPDLHGYQVLRRLRAEGCETPVLVLTGTTDLDTVVLCLQGGADDFVTKPFRKRELIARLQAVVRRNRGNAANQIKVGPVTLDLHWKEVFGKATDGGLVPLGLTKMEYQTFEILVLNRTRTVSKNYLYDHLYDFGSDEAPTMKIIDVYIHKIRQKIQRVVNDRMAIETVWGQGYRLVYQKVETDTALGESIKTARTGA